MKYPILIILTTLFFVSCEKGIWEPEEKILLLEGFLPFQDENGMIVNSPLETTLISVYQDSLVLRSINMDTIFKWTASQTSNVAEYDEIEYQFCIESPNCMTEWVTGRFSFGQQREDTYDILDYDISILFESQERFGKPFWRRFRPRTNEMQFYMLFEPSTGCKFIFSDLKIYGIKN